MCIELQVWSVLWSIHNGKILLLAYWYRFELCFTALTTTHHIPALPAGSDMLLSMETDKRVDSRQRFKWSDLQRESVYFLSKPSDTTFSHRHSSLYNYYFECCYYSALKHPILNGLHTLFTVVTLCRKIQISDHDRAVSVFSQTGAKTVWDSTSLKFKFCSSLHPTVFYD